MDKHFIVKSHTIVHANVLLTSSVSWLMSVSVVAGGGAGGRNEMNYNPCC